MRRSKWKPRQFGRIIATVSDTTRQANEREELMVELLVSAFGATRSEKKTLESLARKLLPNHAARLRQMGRAPLSAAEFEAESVHLIEEAGRQRRARAAKYRPNAYKPPTATRQEFEGTVDIAGRPAPGSYRIEKDLTTLAELTKEQRKFAAQFIGRPLGPITVLPPGAASPKVFDLAQMWSAIATRSKAVQEHLKQAHALMTLFEAKSKECAKLIGDATAARKAGAANATQLQVQAEQAAKAADQLRRDAKDYGDAAYSNVRNAFWAEVHRHPDLVDHFTRNMGLQFLKDGPKGVRGAPFLRLPDGKKEGLTLEHMVRRNDDPRLAVEPKNLVVSPTTENVVFQEGLRNNTPQQF